MPNSPVYRLRIEPRLKRLIDARRGAVNLSAWVREACARRIEAELGLGPEIVAALGAHTRQLRGLGINLNQLAHAANAGLPVAVERQLLQRILGEIEASRNLLGELHRRLPQ